MPTNAQRGANSKERTRKWLRKQGYAIIELELLRNVWTPNGLLPQKRDQLGCDLMGVSSQGYLWVQVKSYVTRRPSLAAARRKIAIYPSPPATKKVIVVWKLRARQPEVIECL